MKECHYTGPETWAPCEFDDISCKQCAYYWDDEEFENNEEEAE